MSIKNINKHICKDKSDHNIVYTNGKEGKGWYLFNIENTKPMYKIFYCPYCEKKLEG